jgi:hypothetical protein
MPVTSNTPNATRAPEEAKNFYNSIALNSKNRLNARAPLNVRSAWSAEPDQTFQLGKLLRNARITISSLRLKTSRITMYTGTQKMDPCTAAQRSFGN